MVACALTGNISCEATTLLGNILGEAMRHYVSYYGNGSLIVLLGAINEYRLRSLRDRQLDYFESDMHRTADDFTRRLLKPQVFRGQSIATVASHILVVIGTLIWGFGDLLIHCFQG